MVQAKTTPRPTAEELLAQLDDPDLLARNRAALAARIRAYEARYGMPSAAARAAVDRGDLRETHDVCRWLIDYELFARVDAGEEG